MPYTNPYKKNKINVKRMKKLKNTLTKQNVKNDKISKYVLTNTHF